MPADNTDTTINPRTASAAAMLMLFVSALPDAMVVPVLRQLVVDRYDVSVGIAHGFMAVNLIGAILAVPLLRRVRRTSRTICLAAAANAVLLAAMAAPIGFVPTLILRTIEGGADLIVYSLLFSALSGLGPAATRARRMGAAATCMMLGITAGLLTGGIIGRESALASLQLGAVACAVVALMALMTPGRLQLRRPARDVSDPDRARLWAPMLMMFTDRALAALFTSTIPLYLASIHGFSPASIGTLTGSAMLALAVGAWPCGRLVDAWGSQPVRLGAGAVYAIGIAAIPLVVLAPLWVASLAMLAVGLAGAGLFAASLNTVCRTGTGPAGMGAYHAAGNAGFLGASLGAGAMLTMAGGAEPPAIAYVVALCAFSMLHVGATATCFVLTRLEAAGPETAPATNNRNRLAA